MLFVSLEPTYVSSDLAFANPGVSIENIINNDAMMQRAYF
jgi:hypothetical protein